MKIKSLHLFFSSLLFESNQCLCRKETIYRIDQCSLFHSPLFFYLSVISLEMLVNRIECFYQKEKSMPINNKSFSFFLFFQDNRQKRKFFQWNLKRKKKGKAAQLILVWLLFSLRMMENEEEGKKHSSELVDAFEERRCTNETWWTFSARMISIIG